MSYLKEISKYKTPEQEDYMEYVQNPTERKKNELVKGNLQLVHKLAKKYQNVVDEFTFDDLIQEGTLGLYKALEKYNPEKGYKFSTYASWFIMGNIITFLKENSNISRAALSVEEERLKQFDFNEGDTQDSVIDIATAEEMNLDYIESDYIRAYFKDIEKILTAREYEVICYLYGYNSYPELTEKEIAKKFEMAESSVRVVKSAALERLKKHYK